MFERPISSEFWRYQHYCLVEIDGRVFEYIDYNIMPGEVLST